MRSCRSTYCVHNIGTVMIDLQKAFDTVLIIFQFPCFISFRERHQAYQETLGNELCALNSWLVDNKLSLHLGKTESILFGSCKKICNSPSLDIKCGDTNISSKKSVFTWG